MKNLLVSGVAGFIGCALAIRLLDRGEAVLSIDNLNDYYDVNLKQARLERLATRDKFSFEKLDISDRKGIEALFTRERFDAVANIAAKAGVRYSIACWRNSA